MALANRDRVGKGIELLRDAEQAELAGLDG
jgi:hypothetical protein